MSKRSKNDTPKASNPLTTSVNPEEERKTVEADLDSPSEADAGEGMTEPKRFCGKKGRSGPPKGNRNGMRHGLTAGQLPKGAEYIENRMNAFRRQLEDALVAAKGQVTIMDAAFIQTALKWERHGALAQRWLVQNEADMTTPERLHFSREIARASTERDKALAALRLDQPKTGWDWDATPAEESNDE